MLRVVTTAVARAKAAKAVSLPVVPLRTVYSSPVLSSPLRSSPPLPSAVARPLSLTNLRSAAPILTSALPTPVVASFRAGLRKFSTDAAGKPVKPRAEGTSQHGKRKRRVWVWALPVGVIAAALLTSATTGITPAQLWTSIRESFEDRKTIADPSIEDLQTALGPPAMEGLINVIISMEDVVLRKDWTNRYGWRYELRPGLKEALKKLTEQGCMITFWSNGSGTGAVDAVNKMVMSFGTPVSFTPLHLGTEHCFTREEGKKEKNIRFFNRNPASILLVDTDKHSEDVNPDNTFIVKGMTALEKEAKESGQTASDTTLLAIVALVERIRADFQQSMKVDVPRTLNTVRQEAGARGFGTDADGVYRYLLHAAWEETERERLRKEAGVGGALRKTIERMPAVKQKPSVIEVAETKPYRDPVIDAGENAILTEKVHKALAKMDAMMGRPAK